MKSSGRIALWLLPSSDAARAVSHPPGCRSAAVLVDWELAVALIAAIVPEYSVGWLDMQRIFVVLATECMFPDKCRNFRRKASDESRLQLGMRVLHAGQLARPGGREKAKWRIDDAWSLPTGWSAVACIPAKPWLPSASDPIKKSADDHCSALQGNVRSVRRQQREAGPCAGRMAGFDSEG